MSEKYTTCLLGPDFTTTEMDLNPGRSIPAGDRKIQLAGGFPSLFPDTPFPLSPTLQLNKDLSSMDEAMLERVARAELDRNNQSAVRHYTVEPSFVVCVLADNGNILENFLDTYGGILEIEALLLEDDHPEHSQVTGVEILSGESGYEISATLRSPVDMQTCNYCGACGPACPESCISPALRFDYRLCTFCRECEKACELNAIDIYGVIKKTIVTPAIITLGEVKVDLPRDKSSIYSEETLAEYFKTLCSTDVEESLQCANELCHYSGRLGAGCNLCYEACEFGAIRRDGDGVHVDAFACTECGKCVSQCPTGAIAYHRFSDESFVDYFSSLPLTDTDAVVLGTSETLQNFWWQEKGRTSQNLCFLEYPRLEALSLFHFLYLLSRGADQILLLVDPEREPDSSCCREVEVASRLCESLFDVADLVKICSPGDLLNFAAPAVLPRAEYEQELPFENRRRCLAELLLAYYRRFEKEITLDSTSGAFGTVLCDTARCTHCFACLNDCKVGALSAGDEARSLLFTSGLCVGCGVCARVCPEDALRVGTETVLGAAFLKPVELAKAEPMACKQCGKEFGTKKGFEKVMKILASKNMADKGHYEYCDTCRVVKLFESHESV
jgi:ferredoxin